MDCVTVWENVRVCGGGTFMGRCVANYLFDGWRMTVALYKPDVKFRDVLHEQKR